MVGRTVRVISNPVAVGFVLALSAACTGGASLRPTAADAGAVGRLFADRPTLVLDLAAPDVPELDPAVVVLVVDEDARPRSGRLDEAARQRLLAFTERGGRLCLLGHAAALVAELGIESEWPERSAFRWGFDRRTAIGRAELGFAVVSGRAPELFSDLTAATGLEHVYFIAGGRPCTAALCVWSLGAPTCGEVLAVSAVRLDGQDSERGAPVLARWRHGRGQVLALGLLPDLAHADPVVRDNGAALLRAMVGPGPLQVARRGAAPLPPPPVRPSGDRPPVPALAHWGWQAALAAADEPEAPRTRRELIDDVLLPSWRAGADLLELDLVDEARGAPFAWSGRDPLPPPPSWRGSAFWPEWGADAVGDVADEAHARGMLISAAIDPLPVGERATERLVALRFLARELADVRRLGVRAIDGFSVRDWLRDTAGYGMSALQDFHAAAFVQAAGERLPDFAGALRALDADDGAPAGLPFAGVTDPWRSGFAPAEFPLGVLDARAVRPPALAAFGAPAGGSAADWIVAQANDFVRARRGQGASLWWRAHDPATLSADGAAYVHGVCQEPLVAAVAMPLTATGEGGLRAAAASLLDDGQPGFGAEVPAPAAVHVLQNNWLRLVGSGGGLFFDPAGEARFRGGEPVLLSPSLLKTRLFGGRPIGDALRTSAIDLLAAGMRPVGGYALRHVAAGRSGGDRRLPAVLAFGAAPAWPQAMAIEVEAETGYHELELVPRGVRGRGLLALRLDGVLLRCLPFKTGERSATATVPVHVARGGPRQFELEVLEGGEVAIDRLRLVRRGAVGAEARVLVPAGSHAVLAEQSASSYHAERLELCTMADLPGFLLRGRCDHAVRNLQIERTVVLPAHTQLAATSDGERADRLRAPFVLRAPGANLPDLVVVPLLLPRNDRFRFGGEGLQLLGAPEPGASFRIGFLLAPPEDSERLLPALRAWFAALDRPATLELGDGGEASLAVDGGAGLPRLVRVQHAAATPFAVRENGWWSWRGAQTADGGGAWLRIRQSAGDTVQIVGGPALFARTRPGPGSAHVVALRDPRPRSAEVAVLQPSRLAPPSVTFAADFGEAYLDGQPWAHFDGRTVHLPDRVGTYRVETRQHAGGGGPHVRCTRAPLLQCRYDASRRELLLVTAVENGRPAELPYTAVLGGPAPVRIEGGELVDAGTLRLIDAEAAALAAAGGAVVRFRSGTTKVIYAP